MKWLLIIALAFVGVKILTIQEWFLIIAFILVWVVFITVDHYKRKAEEYDKLCKMLSFIDQKIFLVGLVEKYLRKAVDKKDIERLDRLIDDLLFHINHGRELLEKNRKSKKQN